MKLGLGSQKLFVWTALAITQACAAQDQLCDLIKKTQGFAPPAAPEAYTFLDRVGKVIGTPTEVRLFPTSSTLVSKRAAAQLCGSGQTERWVFYDGAYLHSLSPNARNFALAHEAAHHLAGDSLISSFGSWTPEMELRADYSAAFWLTRLGVTRVQLLQAFDELAFPVGSVGGYPKRAERRANVLEAIDASLPVSTISELPVGTVRENPKDGLKYVWIKPGTFLMGCSSGDNDCSPNERPAHQVTLTKGYWIGQTLVSQEAYQRVIGKNVSHFKGDSLPVDHITWDEAQRYCGSVGMRLPTEAEWEYAARAGTPGARYGDVESIAWYDGDSGSQTHPVGSKDPNAWNLYDMLGNVWQWTADWYGDKYYSQHDYQDPQGPPAGPSKTFRGGSWESYSRSVRASYRGSGERGYDDFAYGARCAGETIP